MKYLKLCLFLTILPSILLGQGSDDRLLKSRYFQFGLGSSLQKAKDDGMSPVLYRGPAGTAVFSYFKRHAKVWQSIETQSNLGLLRNKQYGIYSSGQALVYRLDADYYHLRFVKKIKENIAWYLGGSFNSVTNSRLHSQLGNSAFNYGGYQSFSLATVFEKPIMLLKREMLLQGRATLPVLSYVTRPNFITLFEYTDPNYSVFKDFAKRSGWHTFNHFVRVNFRTELSYAIAHQNRIKLSYVWDYYSYNQLNKVVTAAHSIHLSTLFKF